MHRPDDGTNAPGRARRTGNALKSVLARSLALAIAAMAAAGIALVTVG